MADHGIKGKTIIIAGGEEPGRADRPRPGATGRAAVAIHYNSPATKADADATVAAVSSGRRRRWRCRPT